MDALKSSFRPDAVAQRQSHGSSSEETAWVVVEKGENFSVDELFNLGEFGNNEQEAEVDEEDVKKAEAAKRTETENNSSVAATASSLPSSSGSAVSFEAPPPLPMPLSLSEMSLPAHVAEELEWVSFIIDDSASEFPAGVAPFNMLPPQAQTKSHDSAQCETRRQQPHAAAVAATQGASFPCSTVHALSTQAPVPARAKRSKRSRTVPVCWSSLRFADSCSTTTTSMTTSSASSCSSTSSSLSCLIYDHPVTTSDQDFLLHGSHPSPPLPPPPQSKNQKLPKKRGRKPKPYADGGASRPSGERRCSHCGVQKTPQWRAGPLGAKTLCNACGVRFKSGRLLPEYRPACSPTFQNSIHSNSHRKVLEMRRKKEILAAAGPPIAIC